MAQFDIPNPANFCGGAYQDWLEVMLTEQCNGRCSWCVEKYGWHPQNHVTWQILLQMILNEPATNIILLGGEPTLFNDLGNLITELSKKQRKVYITTNGSRLNPYFAEECLANLYGINISIHDYNLLHNNIITGINLDNDWLKDTITFFHTKNIQIRFNCNLIRGYIDSETQLLNYIDFATRMGATSVRFAELKFDEAEFVDLAKICNWKWGLNEDPYHCGCHKETIINGMKISFRQMCGAQTPLRPFPANPLQYKKRVLYYDGKIYNGWQLKTNGGEHNTEIEELLKKVKDGSLSIEKAMEIITAKEKEKMDYRDKIEKSSSQGGCIY